MATISLNLSGTLTRSSGSFSAGPDTETGHGSTVQAEASCSVSYNSTGKYYTVNTVYLKLKGQPSGTSVTISSAWANNTSGNWSSFNFKPSKSTGTMTLTWTSPTSITYSSSSISASDIYTSESKTARATLAFIFKIQTTEGTEYYNVYIYLDFKVYGGKPKEYRITYRENPDFGGAQIASYKYNEGSKITIRSAYNRTLSAQTISRGVSFNTLGGVPQPDYRDKSTTQSRKYIFDSWSGRSPGSSLTVNQNYDFTEEYDIDYGEINWKTIGSLPPVNKKGYLKTNVWYDQNGSQVDASTQVTENLTLHPQWDPVTYTVKFDLNGGKLSSEDGNISSYSFIKTYGVGYTLPSVIPLKLGYTFAGWSNQAGTIDPQGAGATMDDRVYNSIYTDYSSGPVTLYAKWNLKPNTVWFDYWYNTQDSDPAHDVHIYKDNPSAPGREYAQYNITQSIFEYGQPAKGTRTGDYVFLGWSDVLPDEYNDSSKVNQGYHGVYNVPPDKIVSQSGETSSIDLPLELKPSDYKTYADWGLDETYYGIWAKTGKYIKIGNTFKKVSTMYAKVAGKWHKIVDAWTCVQSAKYDDNGNLIQEAVWKHEV